MAHKRGHQLDPGQKFPGRQARGLDPGQIADLNRAARERRTVPAPPNSEFEALMASFGGSADPVATPGWAEASLAQGSLPSVIDRTTGPGGRLVGGMGPAPPLTARAKAVERAASGAALRPLDPGLGMTAAEAENEAFQQAIRDAAAAAAGDRSLGSPEPMHRVASDHARFDLSAIADAMMRPDVDATLNLTPDGGIKFSSKALPDQSPGGSANRQGTGFSGLHGFSGLDDLNLPTPDTSDVPTASGPGWGMMGPGTGATTEADVAEYLAMLEGLGSDDARIDFALDPMGDGSAPGFLSEEAAAELRLGGGGLGDPNSDKYVWKDGKIDLIGAPVTTTDDDDGGEDPPGPAEDPPGPAEDPPGPAAEEFTFTENQVNTVTNKVQERANIINSMVKAGLVDIGTARTMYDESVATIFSNFIGEQGRVLRAFKDDLAAAGVQRESDRNAMLDTLRKAGIDPGLISAQLAEIDAIYGEGSQAQRDYLDNITRIGSMANIEHGLMGDYIFGGYEQQLRSEGRRMAADAELAGVDKTEALELAAQQAAQLAAIYGGSPDSILAGLLSGVDVAGTLEQRRAVEDAQQFATDERIASQDFTRGQNFFNTLAGRMTTPYQQAQLDLAEKQYDLNLFETLDEMMQPAAPTALDVDRAHAAHYKSALQKAENFRAYGGSEPTIEERIRGIRPDTLADMLTPDEHLALREFGTSAEELVAEEDNLASLSTVVGIPADVIRGAMESGTASQLLAGPMRDLTARLVDYQAPDGTVLRDIPLTQMVALMEADLTRSDVAATADEPLQFYGFNIGTQQTGVDASSLQAALETLMQGGINIEDPLAAFLAAQTLTP